MVFYAAFGAGYGFRAAGLKAALAPTLISMTIGIIYGITLCLISNIIVILFYHLYDWLFIATTQDIDNE